MSKRPYSEGMYSMLENAWEKAQREQHDKDKYPQAMDFCAKLQMQAVQMHV